MKGEIAKLCDAIMRGEDWTGGEPSLGTCSCIASIKREAARLEAIEEKALAEPAPKPETDEDARRLVEEWWVEWMDDEGIDELYKNPAEKLIERIAALGQGAVEESHDAS